MKRVLIRVVIAALLFGAGLGGGLLWGNREIARLAEEQGKVSDQLRRRLEAAQRRGGDERNRADQMQRRAYELAGEVDRLNENLAALELRKQSTDGESRQAMTRLRKDVAALTEQTTLDKAKIEQSQAGNRQLTQQLAQSHEELEKTKAQNDDARKQLKVASKRLDTCLGHNAAMAGMTSELLTAYENKGVVGALLEREPFTGIKKVEVEHLVQTYRGEIGRNTLKETGP